MAPAAPLQVPRELSMFPRERLRARPPASRLPARTAPPRHPRSLLASYFWPKTRRNQERPPRVLPWPVRHRRVSLLHGPRQVLEESPEGEKFAFEESRYRVSGVRGEDGHVDELGHHESEDAVNSRSSARRLVRASV